jgi:hypothetical protein
MNYKGKDEPFADHVNRCGFDYNEDLGNIVQFYNPVNYSAGAHTAVSEGGDYTLRYTINVTPP